MREQTSLQRCFDADGEEDILIPAESVSDSFVVPERNWNGLIDSYNTINKHKFRFTPLECKLLIEHTKRGIPTFNIFKSMGVTKPKYLQLLNQAQEYEDEFQRLALKDNLLEEEIEKFHLLMRHPLRVLMDDINRAEGISDLLDWEKFNLYAMTSPDVLYAKMKAKFKDYFSDREQSTNGFNVTINLGGDWVGEL